MPPRTDGYLLNGSTSPPAPILFVSIPWTPDVGTQLLHDVVPEQNAVGPSPSAVEVPPTLSPPKQSPPLFLIGQQPEQRKSKPRRKLRPGRVGRISPTGSCSIVGRTVAFRSGDFSNTSDLTTDSEADAGFTRRWKQAEPTTLIVQHSQTPSSTRPIPLSEPDAAVPQPSECAEVTASQPAESVEAASPHVAVPTWKPKVTQTVGTTFTQLCKDVRNVISQPPQWGLLPPASTGQETRPVPDAQPSGCKLVEPKKSQASECSEAGKSGYSEAKKLQPTESVEIKKSHPSTSFIRMKPSSVLSSNSQIVEEGLPVDSPPSYESTFPNSGQANVRSNCGSSYFPFKPESSVWVASMESLDPCQHSFNFLNRSDAVLDKKLAHNFSKRSGSSSVNKQTVNFSNTSEALLENKSTFSFPNPSEASIKSRPTFNFPIGSESLLVNKTTSSVPHRSAKYVNEPAFSCSNRPQTRQFYSNEKLCGKNTNTNSSRGSGLFFGNYSVPHPPNATFSSANASNWNTDFLLQPTVSNQNKAAQPNFNFPQSIPTFGTDSPAWKTNCPSNSYSAPGFSFNPNACTSNGDGCWPTPSRNAPRIDEGFFGNSFASSLQGNQNSPTGFTFKPNVVNNSTVTFPIFQGNVVPNQNSTGCVLNSPNPSLNVRAFCETKSTSPSRASSRFTFKPPKYTLSSARKSSLGDQLSSDVSNTAALGDKTAASNYATLLCGNVGKTDTRQGSAAAGVSTTTVNTKNLLTLNTSMFVVPGKTTKAGFSLSTSPSGRKAMYRTGQPRGGRKTEAIHSPPVVAKKAEANITAPIVVRIENLSSTVQHLSLAPEACVDSCSQPCVRISADNLVIQITSDSVKVVINPTSPQLTVSHVTK